MILQGTDGLLQSICYKRCYGEHENALGGVRENTAEPKGLSLQRIAQMEGRILDITEISTTERLARSTGSMLKHCRSQMLRNEETMVSMESSNRKQRRSTV
jgi:hypothetical protein